MEKNEMEQMLNFDIEEYSTIKIIGGILIDYKISKHLNINQLSIYNFIILVKEGYQLYRHDEKSNPQYHTFQHAADVAYITHVLVSHTSLGLNLDDEHKMLLIITALIHDVGHSGYTNTYLINSGDELIKKYGKQSTLERYHIEVGKKIIKESGIFDHISYVKRIKYLKIINDCILATDMQFHKDYLTLQNKMNTMCIILKCADISNCFRSYEIFMKWSNRIINEFTTQSTLELENNLEISLIVTNDLTYKFIKFVALDLFIFVSMYIPEFDTILNNIENNLNKLLEK
jgi:hypothetical protein